MDSLTTQQRILVIQTYYENGRNIKKTFRELCTIFGRHGRLTEPGIRWILNRFEETGSVEGRRLYQHARPARTPENIAAVSEVCALRRPPYARFYTSTHTNYKIQLTQELKPTDHQHRRVFVNWMLEREDGFSAKVLCSDDDHFYLNGYVNKKNCRFWGSENPHEYHEQPVHPEKVSGGIVGPLFFENAEEKAITVNGERYRGTIGSY